MYPTERNFLNILSELENWANYDNSSDLRDISKLEGIKLLLAKLGNPEKKYRIIHIAGTNGKGSTALIISHLLKSDGFSTGCYTSPHLIDIRERIRINGKLNPIDENKLDADQIKKLLKEYLSDEQLKKVSNDVLPNYINSNLIIYKDWLD